MFSYLQVCGEVLHQCAARLSETLLHQRRGRIYPVRPQAHEAAGPDGGHPPLPSERLREVPRAVGLERLHLTAAHERRHGPRVRRQNSPSDTKNQPGLGVSWCRVYLLDRLFDCLSLFDLI